MPRKLHEVIAVEKDTKSRAYAEVTKLYQLAGKAALFEGLQREYKPLADGGTKLPGESKKVAVIAETLLEEVAAAEARAMDVEATKDFANCSASADVIVNGEKLIEGAPATLLLHLEKRLGDIRNIIDALPTLSIEHVWNRDANSRLHRAQEVVTHRTVKQQRPIVLYEATPEHPAQTQLIVEDITDGHWHTTPLSGALSEPRKQQLLRRIDALRHAVIEARERANAIEAHEKRIGSAIFTYLLS